MKRLRFRGTAMRRQKMHDLATPRGRLAAVRLFSGVLATTEMVGLDEAGGIRVKILPMQLGSA